MALKRLVDLHELDLQFKRSYACLVYDVSSGGQVAFAGGVLGPADDDGFIAPFTGFDTVWIDDSPLPDGYTGMDPENPQDIELPDFRPEAYQGDKAVPVILVFLLAEEPLPADGQAVRTWRDPPLGPPVELPKNPKRGPPNQFSHYLISNWGTPGAPRNTIGGDWQYTLSIAYVVYENIQPDDGVVRFRERGFRFKPPSRLRTVGSATVHNGTNPPR